MFDATGVAGAEEKTRVHPSKERLRSFASAVSPLLSTRFPGDILSAETKGCAVGRSRLTGGITPRRAYRRTKLLASQLGLVVAGNCEFCYSSTNFNRGVGIIGFLGLVMDSANVFVAEVICPPSFF